MIGILLAGGAGTRLFPVTKTVSKHILPVFNQPMIFYPLQTLIDSGITKIIIVCRSTFQNQIKSIVKYFRTQNKISFIFINQSKTLGMADAIKRCKKIVGSDNIMVIAGDNIFKQNFKNEVASFKKGAVSFLRRVDDPSRFGVPVYNRKKLIKIEEKPHNPKSNYVVIGPHFYDNLAFKIIDTLKPSLRGELEITDLNNKYIQLGLLTLKKSRGFWADAGTFDSLLTAGLKLRRLQNK